MNDLNETTALPLTNFLRLRKAEDRATVLAAIDTWPDPGTFVGTLGGFLGRFHPQRMLDGIDADLRLIEAAELVDDTETLRTMAAPYTGHPYFRDEWRTGGMPSTPAGNAR